MAAKTIIKSEPEFDSAWRDRLLLESLVSQILPSLIISESKRVDGVLAMLENKHTTLDDFYRTYPEYKNVEIKNMEAINRRFKFTAAEESAEFFPIVNFNHEILNYLTEIIKKKNILDFKDDKDYQYQLRVSLYNNFNRYLNRLLAELRPSEAEVLCLALMDACDHESFLKLLSDRLKMPAADIINNFLKPAIKN